MVEQVTRELVGRREVLEAFRQFESNNPRGFFVLVGPPGLGKTAVACLLTKELEAVHHLVGGTGVQADSMSILQSILAQLWGQATDGPTMPDGLPELCKRFTEVWDDHAATPLTLVFDGVDELTEQSMNELPFLGAATLPKNVFVVATTRPGVRFEQLKGAISSSRHPAPWHCFELGPLSEQEATELLHQPSRTLSDGDTQRLLEISEGNPLYLRAAMHEIENDANFQIEHMPQTVKGFYQRATESISKSDEDELFSVVALLAVARKPLSLGELAEITGLRQRKLMELGIKPIRQFLTENEEGYRFYHAQFHEYVVSELVFEDERVMAHDRLADWLVKMKSGSDYFYDGLAYHLFHANRQDDLSGLLDATFLQTKLERRGFQVLEDIDLMTQTLLASQDPDVVATTASLVEGLSRNSPAGFERSLGLAIGDVQQNAFLSDAELLVPRLPDVASADLFAGMVSRESVSADFISVVPFENKLALAIGDAPGKGLRSAFVARFLRSLFEDMVQRPNSLTVAEMLAEINRNASQHVLFETISMLCVEIEFDSQVMTFASAGHPLPVLFSSRHASCRRIPVKGELIHSQYDTAASCVEYRQRRCEFESGDVLVLPTDGLTEGHLLTGNAYGYQFQHVIESQHQASANSIGNAILDDWRQHRLQDEYLDDASLLVCKVN